ncbi:hypothetical protein M0804_015470 [Polistes exclamans]|nr:hypothetical protein M0804_015470 [Polistes exclamans]
MVKDLILLARKKCPMQFSGNEERRGIMPKRLRPKRPPLKCGIKWATTIQAIELFSKVQTASSNFSRIAL